MTDFCCNIDWPRHVWRAGLVAVLFCLLVLVGLFNAIFVVPRFYAEQLAKPAATLAAAGDAMKQQVRQLNHDWTESGQWQVEFSDDQINAWLATELLQRLPRALPPDVYDPRVAIESDAAQLAAVYSRGNLSAVLSLAVDASLTDKPNEIALRIRSAKIGSVPGLVDKAKSSIHFAAIRSRVRLRWQKVDGDWVARFDFDGKIFDLEQEIRLNEIKLRDGAICLRGETLPRPIPFVVPPILAATPPLPLLLGNVDTLIRPFPTPIVDRYGKLAVPPARTSSQFGWVSVNR